LNITAHQSNIRTIRQGDPKFTIKDGFVISPRAGFEINQLCPREYKLIISECINNGWLKPVAHVYGKELTMDAMR
jgi:hypothetical protein